MIVFVRFIFCFLFLCATSYGQYSYVVQESDENIDLTNKLYSYVDNTQKLTIEDISAKKELKPEQNPSIAFGYTKANCWVKTEFTYKGANPKDYYFSYLIPLTFNVDFYLYENGKLIKKANNGTLLPFNQREEKNRYFIFNSNLKPNCNYRFFCMSHNDQGASNFLITFKSHKAFYNWYDKENFWLFSFYTLLCLVILSSIALLISFKDKIYLMYAGYILSVLCLRTSMFGFSYKYIYPNIPEFSIISRAMFWLFTFIFFINFAMLLVTNSKIKFPKISMLFKIQTWCYIGVIIFLPINFLIFKFNATIVSIAAAIMIFNFVLSLLLLLTITFKSFIMGNNAAKLFSFSIVPVALIGFLSILANLNLAIHPFLTNYPIEIAVIFELIILSNALISRYKHTMKDSQYLNLKLIEIEKSLQDTHENKTDVSKYQHSKYSKDDIEAKKEVLFNYILDKKPFLDNELSLNKLAEMTNIHAHLISQIINQNEDKNFAEFINHFRIEEAKDCLTNHKFSKYSMEGLGLECGFNSKTTFYATFKKFTGKSPSDYQKNHN